MPHDEPTETQLGLRLLLPALRVVGWVLLTILGPFRVKGSFQVPRSGGVLLLANHISDVDPVVVQAACRRHIFFMAKSELFEGRVLGGIIRWFQAFPVRRGEPDRASIRLAVKLLKNGQVVCVFPEGRLSETGKMLPLLPGVVLIARMANVPVVPCGITGTTRIMPYGKTTPRPGFGWVTVSFGTPLPVDDDLMAQVERSLRALTGQ